MNQGHALRNADRAARVGQRECMRPLLSCVCLAAWLMGCHATSRTGAGGSPGPSTSDPEAAPSTSQASGTAGQAPALPPSAASFPDPGRPLDSPLVPEPPAVADRPVDVDFRVEARTDYGSSFIRSGETLRTGDRLALHVKVSEPAYVYVGLAAPNGKQSILPASADAPFAPGMEHRIPPSGKWFKLARNAGREDIFLYASKQPLSKEQTLQLLRDDAARTRPKSAGRGTSKKREREPRRPQSPAADDAPGALTGATRTIVLEGESGGDVQAESNLTKAHFYIRHR